jgi:predicted transcriptional regulator
MTRSEELSRRERQIMDAIYRAGRASVADVQAVLRDAPSYSAVRTLMGVLEEKGYLRHEKDGRRFVYVPIVPRSRARRSALAHVLDTFFEGSPEGAVATLLELRGEDLDAETLARMRKLIEDAEKDGR